MECRFGLILTVESSSIFRNSCRFHNKEG
jgi:hypothetical protein